MRQTLVLAASLFLLTIGSVRNCAGQWITTDIASGDEALCFAQNGSNFFAGMADSGLYVSIDGGVTWTQSSLQGKIIWAIAAIGTNIFAGTSDDIGNGAVYRSTDNGTNWTPTTGISTAVFCLAVQGTTLFAGTATGSGIFSSTNNGATWNSETETSGATIQALAVIGSNIFAGTDQGMFLSGNSGKSWTAINSGLHQNENIYALAAIGENLFAGTTYEGVCLTTNNGTSWTPVNSGITGPVPDLAVSGSNIFAGTEFGVFLSTNNGSVWTSVSTGAADSNIIALCVLGSDLFCGANKTNTGVYRRPLSQMIAASSVSEQPKSSAIATYPNPFSQSTTIRFTSPEGPAEVSIVNLLGNEISQIYSGELDAGEHSFEWDARSAPDGTYFAVIRTRVNVQRIPIERFR